jgi:hypothetical protein
MDNKIAGIPHGNRGKLPADEPCRMTCREEEMIGMNQIDQIKELQRQGYGHKDVEILWNTAGIEIPALLGDLRRIAHEQT